MRYIKLTLSFLGEDIVLGPASVDLSVLAMGASCTT